MLGNVDGVDNDYIMGWAFDPADPSRRVRVQAFYGDRLLTTMVASLHRPDLAKAAIGDGSHGFYIAMPALDAPEEATISVFFADTHEPVGRPRTIERRPQCARSGLTAAEVLRLHRLPLHSITGLAFNGEKLVVAGLHLPPAGNPSALTVRSTPGVSFSFHYPHFLPNAREWYWYWPNGGWSGYKLEVDLPASTATGPDFEFAFESAGDGLETRALGRHLINVPKDLNVYQDFPRGDQLTRVQTFDWSARVALAGYSHYCLVLRIAQHYGVDLPQARVLDWGCGHGRVIRHLCQQGKAAEAWGVDVDRENVGWLREHLPGVHALAVPLMPPTELPARHFDLVYGISVMTHLTREAQQAWLGELKRVVKPGGLVLLTIAGPTAVAFASRFLSPDWLEGWLARGFDDDQISDDLAGKLEDDTYYRNTKQSWDVTRSWWSEHFEVLAIHECVFGYQDLVAMRAR